MLEKIIFKKTTDLFVVSNHQGDFSNDFELGFEEPLKPLKAYGY